MSRIFKAISKKEQLEISLTSRLSMKLSYPDKGSQDSNEQSKEAEWNPERDTHLHLDFP